MPDRIEAVGRRTLRAALDIWKTTKDRYWIRPFRLYANNSDGTVTAADNTDGDCQVRIFSTAEEAIQWLGRHEKEPKNG